MYPKPYVIKSSEVSSKQKKSSGVLDVVNSKIFHYFYDYLCRDYMLPCSRVMSVQKLLSRWVSLPSPSITLLHLHKFVTQNNMKYNFNWFASLYWYNFGPQSGVKEVIYFVEKRLDNSDTIYAASRKLLSMANVSVSNLLILVSFL